MGTWRPAVTVPAYYLTGTRKAWNFQPRWLTIRSTVSKTSFSFFNYCVGVILSLCVTKVIFYFLVVPGFFPPIYFICINFVFYVMSSKRYCYILVSASVSYMECFLLFFFLTFCLTISSSHSCSTISLQHMSKPCQTCLSKFICNLLCLHHPLCCAFTISPPHMAKPSKPWLSFFITKLLNLSCPCESC